MLGLAAGASRSHLLGQPNRVTLSPRAVPSRCSEQRCLVSEEPRFGALVLTVGAVVLGFFYSLQMLLEEVNKGDPLGHFPACSSDDTEPTASASNESGVFL